MTFKKGNKNGKNPEEDLKEQAAHIGQGKDIKEGVAGAVKVFGKQLHDAIGEMLYYNSIQGPVDMPFENLAPSDQKKWRVQGVDCLVVLDKLGKMVVPARNLTEERLQDVNAIAEIIQSFMKNMTSAKKYWETFPCMELANRIVDGRKE